MRELKDGIRSHVRIDFTGKVHKYFRGTGARQRFDTEVAVLKTLEERGCDFVPRLLDHDAGKLYLVTTNCGHPASQIRRQKADQLFEQLETEFGVRHLDPEPRNVTYDEQRGRFCVIDFELAEVLPDPRDTPPPPPPAAE
jgi:hypothetical protein